MISAPHHRVVRRSAASIGLVFIAASAIGLGGGRPAAAESGAGDATRHRIQVEDLPYSLPMDVSITSVALVTWTGSEALKAHFAPLQCRWCQANALDSGVRTSLRWTDHGSAAVTASDVAAYVVAPLVGLGLSALAAAHEGHARNVLVDFLLTAEAVATAGNISQLVKFSVGRQRPYAHAGIANPDRAQGPADANLSFVSGHTNFTFALTAAAGTIGRMRGYRWATAIYVAGGLIAATTGYFRIAADEHYFTDVLTGAVVGTAVGAGVPYLFHQPRKPAGEGGVRFALVPLSIPGGSGLGCTAVW
jgi:membrane-associated phospholipid phosphatase